MTGQRVLRRCHWVEGGGGGARGEGARIREAVYTAPPPRNDDSSQGKGGPVLKKHRCKNYVTLKLFLRLYGPVNPRKRLTCLGLVCLLLFILTSVPDLESSAARPQPLPVTPAVSRNLSSAQQVTQKKALENLSVSVLQRYTDSKGMRRGDSGGALEGRQP